MANVSYLSELYLPILKDACVFQSNCFLLFQKIMEYLTDLPEVTFEIKSLSQCFISYERKLKSPYEIDGERNLELLIYIGRQKTESGLPILTM